MSGKASEKDRRWAPRIRAWRRSRLKLSAFCEQEGLDPEAMRKAIARHVQHAKEELRGPQP
jgi:hypothetical protein